MSDNTDDRALVDLIERALIKVAGPQTYYRTDDVVAAVSHLIAADRLEAFHAKPVVGEDAIAAGRAFLKSLGHMLEADGICAADIDAGSADHGWRMQAFVAGFSAALQSPPPVVPARVWNDETKMFEHPPLQSSDAAEWAIETALAAFPPPVVEEGWREAIARIIDPDAEPGRHGLRAATLAKADAILALTPVVEEGRREAMVRAVADYQHKRGLTWEEACEDANGIADAIRALTPVEGVRELRCGDDGAGLCAACSLPAHELTQVPGCGGPLPLSTPVAAQGDVRVDSDSIRGWANLMDEFGISLPMDLRNALRATLGTPHEG